MFTSLYTMYIYKLSSSTGGCHIIFLPLNSVPELSKKAKFKNLFDVAYFSNRYVYMKTGGCRTN